VSEGGNDRGSRDRADWYTVVGIVEDRRSVGFGAGLQPPFAVYLSVLQHPARSVDLFVQRPGNPGRITAHATAPVSGADLLAAEVAPLRWFGRMFGMEGWAILSVRFVLLRAAVVAAGGVAVGLWVGVFLWGALATVVAGLPEWDMSLALRFAPILVGAALVGAPHPAWQAARAAPTELTRAAF
jgi:hypothetical protein